MPLVIDAHTVSRADGRPLHRQLADHIRAEITNGALAPGEYLPVERVIADAANISVTAVRDAIGRLAVEGLIIKRSGRPSRVASPPPERNLSTERYLHELALLRNLAPGEPHPDESGFTNDHGASWDAYTVQAKYVEDVASEADARLLEVAPGTPVLRRQLTKYLSDKPVQLQRSVILLDLVAGSPVADPDRQPWPGGTIAELWSVGQVVAHVREEASARTATPDERRLLELGAEPVLDIVRVFSTAERPVEASRVVLPARGVVLRWETDLSGIDV
jgi:GntR family transcriptional regulator